MTDVIPITRPSWITVAVAEDRTDLRHLGHRSRAVLHVALGGVCRRHLAHAGLAWMRATIATIAAGAS